MMDVYFVSGFGLTSFVRHFGAFAAAMQTGEVAYFGVGGCVQVLLSNLCKLWEDVSNSFLHISFKIGAGTNLSSPP